MLDDSFFIDNEGGAIAKALLFVEDAVIFDNGTFEIAQQRKRDPELLREFAVCGNAVYAKTKNLGVGGFEFRDIILIRF